MDWGDNQGEALMRIIGKAAQPLSEGGDRDYGRGMPTWVTIGALLDDCLNNEEIRCAVLAGPLRLL